MREPPTDPTPDAVLATARATWDAEVDRVAYVPRGFGAHHWAACRGEEPRQFLTLDALGQRHEVADLSAAYATARALAATGLGFVHAPLEPVVVPLADGALSATPWLVGHAVGAGLFDADSGPATAAMLGTLHAVAPPSETPPWMPVVPADLGAWLADLTATTWDAGPYAAPAHDALAAHQHDVERWTARYHHLAAVALERPWVVTHGEPDTGNQMHTPDGPVLVDWESVKLAPRERDLRALVDQGWAGTLPAPEPTMMELFDLEWRLDEVRQYAAWFAAPHLGTADDDLALGGLLEELARPEWSVRTSR